MRVIINILFGLLSALLPFPLQGKGLYGIGVTNYGLEQYQAGLQNWGLDTDGYNIYVANNQGLLLYNGNDWQLLQTPTHNVLRDVAVIDKRVYVTGNDELGYWTKTNNGKYSYVSLWEQVEKLGIPHDVFWTMIPFGNELYFRSYSNIIKYDGKKLSPVVLGDCYVTIFNTPNNIVGQHITGTFKSLGGSDKLSEFPASGNSEKVIRFCCPLEKNEFLMVYQDGSIAIIRGESIEKITCLKGQHNESLNVEGADYRNGIIVVATLGNGLILYDLKKRTCIPFDNKQFKDFNFHRAKFIDDRKIWCTTDVGITSVDLSPSSFIQWRVEDIGVFFGALAHNENTFIATNRGLFNGEGRMETAYKGLLPLAFTDMKGDLLVGTTSNLFRYNQVHQNFEPFHSFNGVRCFEYVTRQGHEYLMMRGYAGLGILEWRDGRWEFRNAVDGTEDYDLFLPESPSRIWAQTNGKGLELLTLSNDLSKVESQLFFDKIGDYALIGDIHPFKIESQVYFATPHDIYTFNAQSHEFVPNRELTETFCPDNCRLEAIGVFPNGKIWTYRNDILSIYRIDNGRPYMDKSFPLSDNPLVLYDRHYTLSLINDSTLLAATLQGIQRFNLEAETSAGKDFRIEAVSYDIGKESFWISPVETTVDLPNSATNITFRLTGSVSDQTRYYSYLFEGLQKDWSRWQKSGYIRFSSIPFGTHQLTIRDSQGHRLVQTVSIAPAGYMQWWAILLYVLAISGIALLLFWRVEYRKRRKIRHLLEKENARLQNELKEQENRALREKVHAQETEMVSNLKILTQKQELIDCISAEIEKQKKNLGERWPNKNYMRLLKIIQDGATETDKLLTFENFFVEIHKDFMDRVHAKHPELSGGELRLACLIRANLANKEIAAVMAIGVRSVEIKRYRLKKKFGLSNEKSLTTYINSI